MNETPYWLVFSGDTVIETEYWGQKELQRCFSRFLAAVKLRHPFRRVYWFLISGGYRTYLLLANNFLRFYPRYDRPTPAFEAEIIRWLTTSRYHELFDATRGVVNGTIGGIVKDGVADLSQDLLDNPHIRFFREKNPRFASGDELACIGQVSLGMIVRVQTKVWLKRLRRPATPRIPDLARGVQLDDTQAISDRGH